MAEEQARTQFGVQRIFTRNTSFESPNVPDVFRQKWQPKLDVDLDTQANHVSDNTYQVLVRVTVTAKLDDQTAFLAEVEQGCIATIAGFGEEQLDQMLGAYLPALLFPYARETIDTLVVKGSFPPVMLAPVNFDALYKSKKEKQQGKNPANNEASA